MEEIRYVQLVLTTSQVELLQGAAQNAVTDAGNEQEAAQLAALLYFLDAVVEGPDSFPVTAPGMPKIILMRRNW